MKLLLILLLIGCTSVITKQRTVKEKVVDLNESEYGLCEYMTQPRHNYITIVIDTCGKYEIGDFLYRIEEYTVETK